jgi:hypothetical protein
MTLSRRGFLSGLVMTGLAAPAIVRATSLMPVRAPKIMKATESLVWYVSPGGSACDTNAGTEAEPFATIQRAMREVRKFNAGTIVLADGTYERTDSVIIDDLASVTVEGSDPDKTIIQAVPSHPAFLVKHGSILEINNLTFGHRKCQDSPLLQVETDLTRTIAG